MNDQYNDPKAKAPTTQLWRTKWKSTGKLIATFSTESLAKFMFESANRSYPNEIIIEEIPENEPDERWKYGYGRDEHGED